jgi:hypothetical protein
VDEATVKLDLMIKEYTHVATEIAALYRSTDRPLAIGLAVVSGGLLLGLQDNLTQVLLVLQLALFGVLFSFLVILTELKALGGYRRFLERAAESAIGRSPSILGGLPRPPAPGDRDSG